MGTPFLTSEDYEDLAHDLYHEGDLDRAVETLREGLQLYPHSVELHVGLGFTQLTREEFGWAKRAFETALVLDPESEHAMVGLGEVLFFFNRADDALVLFDRARERGHAGDPELLLGMGRALYRSGHLTDARDVFFEAIELYPESADALASAGRVLDRLGDEKGALRVLRRALRIDPRYHDARVYMAYLLDLRGDFRGALRNFEYLNPDEHWDPMAVNRLIDLKCRLDGLAEDDFELNPWRDRLSELTAEHDPVEHLLAEVQMRVDGGEPGDTELFDVT